MGLDDTVNLERIAAALEKLSRAFDQYNILYRDRLNREFPPEKKKRGAEIIVSASESRREEIGDRPTDEWMRDTQAALDNQKPSRFQQRFDQTESSHRQPQARRRRAVALPEVH